MRLTVCIAGLLCGMMAPVALAQDAGFTPRKDVDQIPSYELVSIHKTPDTTVTPYIHDEPDGLTAGSIVAALADWRGLWVLAGAAQRAGAGGGWGMGEYAAVRRACEGGRGECGEGEGVDGCGDDAGVGAGDSDAHAIVSNGDAAASADGAVSSEGALRAEGDAVCMR